MLLWRRVTKPFCAYTGLVFALLTVVSPEVRAEEDWSASARELVRELLAEGARPEGVALTTRNRVSGARPDLRALEEAVAEALRARDVNPTAAPDEPVAELKVTLTSNPRGLLLVGEMGGEVAVVELDAP